MLSAMTVTAQSERAARAPLSRQQVLRAALDYVDQHGLEALSMHKLGAELGVKAMSLYKHVADKDDILDGIVDLLWDEIPAEPAAGDWREAIRQLAAALRDLVHRHPHAAALLVCGDCDMTAQFRIGVDLMIHGLDAYLATLGLEEDAAARCS